MLNRDLAMPITLIAFDVLRIDGESLLDAPFDERRDALVGLALLPPRVGHLGDVRGRRALFQRVCELGLEGVVAKRLDSRYGPTRRGWIKTKNPNYWRLDLEREAMQRSRERRARAHVR